MAEQYNFICNMYHSAEEMELEGSDSCITTYIIILEKNVHSKIKFAFVSTLFISRFTLFLFLFNARFRTYCVHQSTQWLFISNWRFCHFLRILYNCQGADITVLEDHFCRLTISMFIWQCNLWSSAVTDLNHLWNYCD